MNENPYLPARPEIGDVDHSNVTVRIAPHNDGCEALIEVTGKTYSVNETQQVYAELWYLIDLIVGDVECQHYDVVTPLPGGGNHYAGQCSAKVYEHRQSYCDKHKAEHGEAPDGL